MTMKHYSIQKNKKSGKSRSEGYRLGSVPFVSNSRATIAISAVLIIILTILMLAGSIFAGKDFIISRNRGDICLHYVHLREFGFRELRNGNLALWNPYVFSGSPFFGFFQSALLYPPNWLHLILSVSRAINLLVAAHIILAGLFMYLWVAHRRLHPGACLLSAILWMFSAPLFMHVYAGHLPVICVMAWAPLILLAIDGMFDKPSLSWFLLGAFAVAMQGLAGFPQCMFYTLVAVLFYSGIRIIKTEKRLITGLCVMGMYVVGSALSAVQLLTGLQAAAESIRGGGVKYDYAAMFSFPPENLITLLVPGFFGNMIKFPYWGRCFLWEMSLYIGVSGFFLALYGAIFGDKQIRRLSLAMVFILIVLALGSHTPLFNVLYYWIPGFNSFRGMSKFILQATLFTIMLAGVGFDRMLRKPPESRAFVASVPCIGLVLGILAFFIRTSAANPDGLWKRFSTAITSSAECYIGRHGILESDFFMQAGKFASESLLISTGICLLLFVLLVIARKERRAVYAIGVLAVVEILVFARMLCVSFDSKLADNPSLRAFLAKNPGDYRILWPDNPNHAMCVGRYDVWGYDALVLRRYAEFIAFINGKDPDEAKAEIRSFSVHPLASLIRCRYVFIPQGGAVQVFELPNPLPLLNLVQDWKVATGRDDILAKMSENGFNPRKTVILESEPYPKPVPSGRIGKARLLKRSTDELVVEAELPDPAILLITDAYSKGWRAKPLPGSDQRKYNLMPADYILRAIPLSAGHHWIKIEYVPSAFTIGKWISIVSSIIYLFAVVVCARRSRKLI